MKKGFLSFWLVAIVSAALIVSAYIGYYFFIPEFICGDGAVTSATGLAPWEKCGVFGDSYGALTCLFSALAFWGALMTLWIQYGQRKDDRRQIALEHLPLVVRIPQTGRLTASLTNGKKPVLNLSLVIEECNASEVAALSLAHRSILMLSSSLKRRWSRRVNFANNLQSGRPMMRNETFAIFGKDGVVDVLTALLSENVLTFPILTLGVSYRNIFDSYAKSVDVYRVKLKNRAAYEAGIRRVLAQLASSSDVKNIDFAAINGADLVLTSLAERAVLKAVTVDEYKQFLTSKEL